MPIAETNRRIPLGMVAVMAIAVIAGLVVARSYLKRQRAQQLSRPEAATVASADGPTGPSDGSNVELVTPVLKLDDPSGLDPIEQGWTSEAFYNDVQGQLNRLKAILGAGKQIEAAEITSVVTPNFSCERLRPVRLQTVLTSPGIRVVRGKGPAQAETYTGADGFVAAVSQLLATELPDSLTSLQATKDVLPFNAEFKVVSTQLHSDFADTRMLVHLFGIVPNHAVQLNAVWRCRWSLQQGLPPRLSRITPDADRFQEITTRYSQGTLFSDCSQSVLSQNEAYHNQLVPGVMQWLARLDSSLRMELHGTHGIAIGDANGDGMEDVYLCQPSGLPNRLFIHNSDGTVSDASSQSGADFCDGSLQALFVDLDNDHDQDLAVIVKPDVAILANDGVGHFQLVSRYRIPGNLYALTAVDYDLDGLLDLYACVRDDDPTTKLAQGLLGSPIPYHDANNGGANALLRNLGELRFSDVTASVGLQQNNTRFSQAACWEDYDNDGDLDLYVANDFGRNNLYRNEGGRFRDVAAEAGVEDISAGMSVSWGDYDNDGWMDLYVSNMFSSAGNRVAFQRKFKPNAAPSTLNAYRRHARGNTLFRNLGDGTFEDVSQTTGVTMGRWAWSSAWVDINNDSWQDILVANGFITGEDDDDL